MIAVAYKKIYDKNDNGKLIPPARLCLVLFFKHIYLFKITNSFWATKLVSCVWIMKNYWIMHGSVINNHVSEGSLEQHGILIYLENLPVLAIQVWIAGHSLIFVVLSFEFTWIIISNIFFLFWNKSGSKSVCNWRRREVLKISYCGHSRK